MNWGESCVQYRERKKEETKAGSHTFLRSWEDALVRSLTKNPWKTIEKEKEREVGIEKSNVCQAATFTSAPYEASFWFPGTLQDQDLPILQSDHLMVNLKGHFLTYFEKNWNFFRFFLFLSLSYLFMACFICLNNRTNL